MTREPDQGNAAADRAGRLPRVVFFGSGEFGVPVLEALHAAGAVALVVSQPDKPAGRGGALTPTPVSAWAIAAGVPLDRPDDCNEARACERIRSVAREAAGAGSAESAASAAREAAGAANARERQPGACYVVIAYGQKMGPELLAGTFAINLHGSLLPRWRGAAPYQRALMEGDRDAGVTVIAVAERMDAGAVFAEASLAIGPDMTARDLHDALRALGPEAMLGVLRRWVASGGSLAGQSQDESKATRARKLSKADAWVDLALPANLVRARINGLSPWPGCMVTVDGHELKVLRARVAAEGDASHAGSDRARVATGAIAGAGPGAVRGDLSVACGTSAVEFLEVQQAGGRPMTFAAWCAGRRLGAGARVVSAPPRTPPNGDAS